MSRATTRPARTRPDRRPGHRRPRTTSAITQRLTALGRGVRIVAELDLRSSARSRLTWGAVAAWITFVYGLLILALVGTSGGATDDGAGALVHSLIATFALAAGLTVVPALGAGTLNRNRDSGLLDMLRVTQLSPRSISWGIFVGSLARVLVLVLLTVPALATGLALGGTDVCGFAWAVVVLAVSLAAAAAVAQAVSAVFARRTTALVAAYTATGLLVLGPWVAYAAALPLTSETVSTKVTVLAGTHGTARAADGPPCVDITEDRERTRPDRIWWLLAPEPFVALADAAPGRIGGAVGFEPLSAGRDALRLARITPPGPGEAALDECPVAVPAPQDAPDSASTVNSANTGSDANRAVIEAVPPTWPIGMAVLSLTGAAAIGLSTRRLRAPGVPAVGEHLVDTAPNE